MTDPRPTVGVDDIAELRSLLRRHDVAARRVALATIATWRATDLDRLGARAVLEAAGGAYPVVAAAHGDPAELLARLLWDAPHDVAVADVVRVSLVAGERTRRALVHLLAIRGGLEGLAGLEVLLGPDADTSTLPAATTALLDPLLLHPERDRVVRLCTSLVGVRGWTWHSCELLERLLAPSTDAIDRSTLDALAVEVDRVVADLVDACDRASRHGRSSGDSARVERESLARLVGLLGVIETLDATARAGWIPTTVLRLLGSADPRVSAMGVARRVLVGAPVASERIAFVGRDPLARVELARAVDGTFASLQLGDGFGRVALREGELVELLVDPTELARVPDEIEHVATQRVGPAGASTVDLYRFRLGSPHWSAARGWMIGAAGAFTGTSYLAEDECTLAEHVATIHAALTDWPGDGAAGAA